MEFIPTPLAGAMIARITKIEDHRGFFGRAWCRDEFRAHGIDVTVAQINTSFTPKAGTFRGLHFQFTPRPEAKVVRCTRGAIWDVIIDLRPGSPTYRKSFGVELSAENLLTLHVPGGFAHGFQTLAPDSEMYYLASEPYNRTGASGVRYNDPAFDLSLPRPVTLVSDADLSWPDFLSRPQAAGPTS